MNTMLLVNDDPTALNGLEEILQRRRYAVIAARDGSAALAAIAQRKKKPHNSFLTLLISDPK